MNRKNQIVGVFNTLNEAETARDDVKALGVSASNVRVISPNDISGDATGKQDDSEQSITDQISDFFASVFGKDDEEKVSERYLKTVRSGSTLVVVDAQDDDIDRSRIEQILRHDTSASESMTAGSPSLDPASHTTGTEPGSGIGGESDRHPAPTGADSDPADRDTINAGTDSVTGTRNRNEMV